MNHETIGKTYPPVVYEVGREKIQEYARATLQDNPLYSEPEFAALSKYGTIVAPPSFVAVYCGEMFNQLFSDEDLGIDLPRIVHGEQEFKFRKVVRSGDIITSVAKIVDVFSKQSDSGVTHEFGVLKSESKNQHGQMVCEGIWTVIQRGVEG